MPPFKGRAPPGPSMKYKFSEPLFAFSVKWGYSVLPDYGDSQRRQRMSNPFADSTLLLWCIQVMLTSTSLHVPGVPKGPGCL